MIGILDWELRAADITLTALAGTMNIDEMNVPAITASVLVPYDADVFAALDPRQTPPPRAVLRGTFTQWASQPLSAMTSYFADNSVVTLADLSSLWSGLTLGDITDLFATPLDAAALGNLEPDVMEIELHVRELDASSWDMSISLASDEALLTDWTPTDGLDFGQINDYAEGMPVQQARTYIDPILQTVLGIRTDTNVYSSDLLSSPYADVINRTLDMSAWELVRQPLDDAGLKLRVNRDGRGFSLQHPVNEIPTKTWLSLFGESDVISVRHKYSRNDDWYDSALLSSVTAAGAATYKGGPTGTHSRTYRESYPEGTKFTSSQIVNINLRNANRGQFIIITAPIRLGVFMMDEFAYAPTVGPVEQWRVQGVSYDIESGTMNILGVQRY